MAEQYAGESDADYIRRLESECALAESEAKRANQARDEANEARDNLQDAHDTACADLEFLREQIADLAMNIASPSAPRSKGEMARLLNGLLNGQHWQHCTWRIRRAQQAGTAKEDHIRAVVREEVLVVLEDQAATVMRNDSILVLGSRERRKALEFCADTIVSRVVENLNGRAQPPIAETSRAVIE